MLFNNGAVLIANGPRGSYRAAKNGPERWKNYHYLNAAYKIALACGLIPNKFAALSLTSVEMKVGENLVKIKKVAQILEGMVEEGLITGVKNGVVYYPRDRGVVGLELLEAIVDRAARITGYGEIDRPAALRNLQKREKMFVSDNRPVKSEFIGRLRGFMGTWGAYSYFLDRVAIDMAASQVLYRHKKSHAEEVSSTHPLTRFDACCALAEKEARHKEIEEIKRELQADNPYEIPAFVPADGEPLPKYVFVISDVHLREMHHENTDEILRFIWMLKRLNARLIVNGDFFDVWRAGGLDKAWVNNTRIINALGKLKEVYLVAGNHDEFLNVLAKRGGVMGSFRVVREYVSADGRIRIFHGHKFDPFNRPGSWFGRWLTKLVRKFEMPRLVRFLEGLNKTTAGFFTIFSSLFNFFFGPHLSERLTLLPKLILPTAYILNRKVDNIMDWIETEVEAAKREGVELDEQRPLTFIIGHFHYEGISFLDEKVREALKSRYGAQVKLIITDSWMGGEDYVSDYVCMADISAMRERGRENGSADEERLIVRKLVWERTRR